MGVSDVNNSNQQFLDINAKTSAGATPLELAAQQGNLEVVRYIIYTCKNFEQFVPSYCQLSMCC